MPPVTLKGHLCTGHGCFPSRPSAQGEERFRIDGIAVHCRTHAWTPHGCPTCVPHASVLARGAPAFRIDGRDIGRIGDPVACGSTVQEGVPAFRVGNAAQAHAELTARVAAKAAAAQMARTEAATGGARNAQAAQAAQAAADMDALLLCIPGIAEAEAGRADDPNDAQGWRYLKRFFWKWFQARVGPHDYEKPGLTRREDRPPSYVAWDWLLSYDRARAASDALAGNILNDAAKTELAKILGEQGLLQNRETQFDFIAAPERDRHELHHQSRAVEGFGMSGLKPDGMTASLASFRLYGLAAGAAIPKAGGGHEITVTRTAIFMRDNFDFVDDDGDGDDQTLGWWDCANKEFTALGTEVNNSHLRAFRQRHGRGGDFYVYATARDIEDFKATTFDAPLDNALGEPHAP